MEGCPVVCGFAFDARADEETGKAMRFGKLTVLTVRINPDLSMGEDLLKKTRTGNLFTIFGQLDVDIRRVGEGQLQVEIRGLDTYNPTNGEVVPNPLPVPDSGCIAIKVIHHYGDEILKVYGISAP